MNNCTTYRLTDIVIALAIVFLLSFFIILWSCSNSGITKKVSSINFLNGSILQDKEKFFFEQNLQPVSKQAHDHAHDFKLTNGQLDKMKENTDAILDYSKSHQILPNNHDNAEYIVLTKCDKNSYEDLSDEYVNTTRHHSGHFRDSQSMVWDPHPQYQFAAFGHRFHIHLREDSSFVATGVTITHMSENIIRREYPDSHLGCFYTGHVENDPKSAVTVSLCHGMTGHIRTSTGNYIIKPINTSDEESSGNDLPLQHVIYRLSKTDLKSFSENTTEFSILSNVNNIPKKVHTCGVIDDDYNNGKEHMIVKNQISLKTSNLPDNDSLIQRGKFHENINFLTTTYENSESEKNGKSSVLNEEWNSNNWRRKRALPREYFIEIMVVADATMIHYHGKSLTNYILVLMNTVSRIYKDPSIGNPISIAVIKIKQIHEIFGVKERGSDGIEAADMLRKFCDWQYLNNPHEPSSEHHDAALLLTRENLCHKSEQSRNKSEQLCDTLGLAELGRMCSIKLSCAIVQDNGLATAFTIAHEIGHVLNMPHDDDQKCARYRDRLTDNIMSRMLDDKTVPWEWSKCSRHYLTEFLDAGLGNCLLDEPGEGKIIARTYASRLPGEDYSENKQCELVYGAGSEICPHDDSLEKCSVTGQAVCKRLWCTAPSWNERSEQCHTQHMPWADGTVCGKNKWCHRGECVSRENLEPVDGQWGEWSSYGECSRTCGGGIKKKYRQCDNPSPENGGNYCIGERVRFRSCGTKDCPSGTSLDFREEQCAEFDNDNRNIRNLTKNVKWHAKYDGILTEDRCKLYCQVASNQYYVLREKVVDGTPCGLDTFHVCVNGHCKPAGCDHMLNSTATLDACGVCRGDNSTCQRISGSYNSSEYGYAKVTRIPAGSSYIDIKQYGWNGTHNDSNYLALRLKDSGKYILNGNFMVMQQKVIMYPGATIEYSGPEQVVERLNSSRPIHVDLILEVLSVGNVNPPQITYEYTVPKKILDRFTWVLSDWTTCDRMCQGMSYRQAQCRSAENQDIVSSDYCSFKKKPREESQSCNNYCELQWHEIPNSRSECSSHCGAGTLYVKYRCVQVPVSSVSLLRNPRPMPSHACYHLEQPQELQPCIGSCENVHWKYGEWSTCSVTCGDNGFRYRSAVCVGTDNRTLSDDNCSHLNRINSQSCGYKSCPTWTFGDWTACSVSCGIGKRERQHWCRIDNRVVHSSLCSSQPAETSETCDAGLCSLWHSSDWSPCSATCGDAVRKRMVTCKYSNGSTSQNCDSSSRPINSISCALEPCWVNSTRMAFPSNSFSNSNDEQQHENDINDEQITFKPEYSWHVDGFEKCSKSCGGGYAKQIVKCFSRKSEKIALDEAYCKAEDRPRDVIACNEHQCPNWTTGSWSQCDVKCGNGYQHRQILCQDIRGEILNDSACSEKSKPRHARKCQKAPCILNLNNHDNNFTTYKWHTGPWSECSASCGNGVRRRKVSCHRVNGFGWQDPSPSSHGCVLLGKPSSEQFCKIRGCNDQFYWMAGNWKKCSHPCGKRGRQIRRLFCLDLNGRKSRRKHCPSNLRPQRKRKCNQKPCFGPTSCLDLQTRLKTNIDGEYTLLVGGRYMSIYCHGMQSHEPQEYLTLPTGERENYAEVYEKRLRNPHSCPYEGRRNDSCDCMTEAVTISGRSMFRKLRINVHTLHIIADDYRFSMKIGANHIEYGKAGDCYSQMDCPQGRFGINLSGTLLMLSPDVYWPKQENAFVMINKINNQRIIGKCGGYCGFCMPFPALKLNVLPP